MNQINNKTAPFVVIYSKSKDVRRVLDAFLATCNFRVVEVVSEIELLRVIKMEKPSIVLFDLSQAFQDDLQFLSFLRGMESFENISIFVLSGHARSNVSTLATLAGADEYFIKPIEFNQLENSLKTYAFDRRNQNKAMKSGNKYQLSKR